MNNNNNDCDGWRDKLVGKKILKDNEETALSSDQFVRESELPKLRRVLPPNGVMTMDYRPERLNIHLDHNQKVQSVNFG
ncbi:hypothetical protein BDA99DRAFT_445938 [Phascolomyces articulosus]|uniref:Proteinase inhibitor I78 n=1 Tax=Phascolomyces articulosus TaxID=60185 RepID=A0AAD5K003_9FUNG|nr:hypothetical protein BDA99DRAFT_445938 [Phascolomyces articulosus]